MNVSAQRSPLPTRILAVVLEGLKLFGIAIGCLIIFAFIFFISIKTGIVIAWRWVALAYWTGFLIWLICRLHKPNLMQGKFWFTLFCLLLIHMIAFIAAMDSHSWGGCDADCLLPNIVVG